MKDNNLPDDCQGNGTHLPWNQPEEEAYCCWHCSEEVNEDELTEVKTKYDGNQFIAECCIDQYFTEGV
jgi:hypothetical protein